MNSNERITIKSTGSAYASVLDLNKLTNFSHKCKNSAAIYGDHLLYNINFQCKDIYKYCQFIYVIRSGKETLSEIVPTKGFEANLRYYQFRLRRIYEMAKHTANSAFLSWPDIKNGKALKLVEDFLHLKTALPVPTYKTLHTHDVPVGILNKAQDCFEYYLYKIQSLKHLKLPI